MILSGDSHGSSVIIEQPANSSSSPKTTPISSDSSKRCFTMVGFEVELLSTGPKALTTYEALFTNGTPPAIVIADLGLPGLDGRSLLKKIREFDREACLLLTSGYTIEKNGTDGFNFIKETVRAFYLLRTIRTILTNRRIGTKVLKSGGRTSNVSSEGIERCPNKERRCLARKWGPGF
jgi:CheY-like chemotaxis protein